MSIPYTVNVQSAIKKAQQYCVENSLERFTLAVLFLQLLDPTVEEEPGIRTLIKLNVSKSMLRSKLQTIIDRERTNTAVIRQPTIAEDLHRILQEVQNHHAQARAISSGELILTCLQDDGNVIATVLNEFDVTYDKFYKRYRSLGPRSDMQDEILSSKVIDAGTLIQYSTNVTELARAGKIDPIVGREIEVQECIKILSRRNKNNPVLLGNAGVGKTAIVEALAIALTQGKVPVHLREKEIFSIDMVALTAGTKFRGDFENRLSQILKEAKKDSRIVLFLDEIHTMVGAGSHDHDALDMGNAFKPALSRGQISVIGATTKAEYDRTIGRDPALSRRFDIVDVDEPSPAEVTEILKGLIKTYAKHHDVGWDNSVIPAIVEISPFIPNKHQPDKAIDLLDRTFAAVKCEIQTVNPPVDLPVKEREELIKKTIAQRKKTRMTNRSDVIQAASTLTKIPVRFLDAQSDKEYLSHAEQFLKKRLINQPDAIEAMVRVLRASKAGILNRNRPKAVVYMDGPEGTGKSRAVELFTEIMLGDVNKLYRIDLSTMKDKFNMTRLSGAPPGYVGHDSENDNLVNHIRRNNVCVVLLDEIDSCDTALLDFFIPGFECGYIEDSFNRKVDVRNVYFFLTGNLTSKLIRDGGKKSKVMGFQQLDVKGSLEKDCKDRIHNHFHAKFMDRIDEVVLFNTLSKENLLKIVDLEISEMNASTPHIKFSMSDAAKERIVELSSEDKESKGARKIKRTLFQVVTPLIAQSVFDKQSIITIDYTGDQFVVGEDNGITDAVKDPVLRGTNSK